MRLATLLEIKKMSCCGNFYVSFVHTYRQRHPFRKLVFGLFTYSNVMCWNALNPFLNGKKNGDFDGPYDLTVIQMKTNLSTSVFYPLCKQNYLGGLTGNAL